MNEKKKSKRIVLLGATGLIGHYCLDLLLQNADVGEVIAFTRRSLKTSHPKLAERVLDLESISDPSQLSELKGIDAIVSCLGTTIKQAGTQAQFEKVDFGLVLLFAEWGIARGCSHFLVVSSLGADENSPLFYSRTKGKMEKAVARLGYSTLDIFRPSLLLGKREKPRGLERLGEKVMNALNPLMIGALRKYKPIHAQTVARAILVRLFDQEKHKSVNIYLSNEIETLAKPADARSA